MEVMRHCSNFTWWEFPLSLSEFPPPPSLVLWAFSFPFLFPVDFFLGGLCFFFDVPTLWHSEVSWPSIWWLQQNHTPHLWAFCSRVARADSCFCAPVLSFTVSHCFSLSMPFTTDERVVVFLSIFIPATCWFHEWGSAGSDGRVERRMAAEMQPGMLNSAFTR